jgi:hypothetical protein
MDCLTFQTYQTCPTSLTCSTQKLLNMALSFLLTSHADIVMICLVSTNVMP